MHLYPKRAVCAKRNLRDRGQRVLVHLLATNQRDAVVDCARDDGNAALLVLVNRLDDLGLPLHHLVDRRKGNAGDFERNARLVYTGLLDDDRGNSVPELLDAIGDV